MGLTSRSTLEILLPIALIYIFVLGAPFPSHIFSSSDYFTQSIQSTTPQKQKQKPVTFTQDHLVWATGALAWPRADGSNCPDHGYKTRIYSITPLVIYIENFLSPWEAALLRNISEPNYTPSTIHTPQGEHSDPTIRTSLKSPLNHMHPTVKCIEHRARSFQGFKPELFIERLYAQKYEVGGHYARHFDWGVANGGVGRVSSFMVWLGDDCAGGGTEFPRLKHHLGREWCADGLIECDDVGNDSGHTTFRPLTGNAVYWENFDSDGRGYEESLHAGLPITKGVKVGLNIWSWWQPGLGQALEGWERD